MIKPFVVTILTIFPEFFTSIFSSSILKRAQEKNLVEFRVINIRDFATDKHRTTDDHPYGGGAGMVMKIEPIVAALRSLPKSDSRKVLLTSAKGELFTQQTAREYAKQKELVIICGHYEGVDERIAEHFVDEEVRIGDYVLTGGEPAAAVMIDAITRLLPGVLGNEESATHESHEQTGVFEYPQYTRPEKFENLSVPEVLLNGNHHQIEEWREQARKKSED